MTKRHNKGHIAFISIDDGASASKPPYLDRDGERPSDNCSRIAWDLAEQGWYVDLFAHQSEPPVQDDHPRYRKIFLPISLDGDIDNILDALEAAAQAFLRYQETQGILYPIIHTHCWASAWVGARIKQHQFVRLVHTACGASLSTAVESVSDRHPAAIERQCLEAVDCLVVADPPTKVAFGENGRHQDSPGMTPQTAIPGIISASKIHQLSPHMALADQLDGVYREQLDLLCHQFFFASPLPMSSQQAVV